MGVLNLWKILNPTCEPVGLNELQNKTLAVDLSIWIVENSTCKFSATNAKPHLRALFFRCKSLLEIGCKLIFVREGDVIELKQDTMKKRNQARYGEYHSSQSQSQPQSQPQSQTQSTKKRSRFDHVADECCDLLKSLGITVIRSPCGEAEKACAYLNLIGRCDGVITDDSDVFLYGAKVVYRNFCLDKKSEIKIEKYSMNRIETDLGYSREYLIVLALLLGCDYDPKGIPGVGRENATKFLNEIVSLNKDNNQIDILELIRSWPKQDFVSNGLKYENRIRKTILLNENLQFPNEEIIKEYLNVSKLAQILLSQEKYLSIKWSRPNLKNCQLINEVKQNWPYDYTANKVVSLIVQYENENVKNVNERILNPIGINKTRRQAFHEYFEVRWHKIKSKIDEDLSELDEYVTLEKPDVFEKLFPHLVIEYKTMIETKKANRKVKKIKEIKKKTESNACESDEDDFYDGMTSLMELYENYEKHDEYETEKTHKIPEDEQLPIIKNNSYHLKDKSNISNNEYKIFKESLDKKEDAKNSQKIRKKITSCDANDENDDIIILDDSQDLTNQSREINAIPNSGNDINLLLENFANIKISKDEKVKKKSAKNNSQTVTVKNQAKESNDSSKTAAFINKDEPNIDGSNREYVPFSMRMKQIYKNASIFDN